MRPPSAGSSTTYPENDAEQTFTAEYVRKLREEAAAQRVKAKRGQRRRDAQARCPHLEVVLHDPVRDHRAFAHDLLLGREALLEKGFVAAKVGLLIGQKCLILGELGLRLLQPGLIDARVDLGEDVTTVIDRDFTIATIVAPSALKSSEGDNETAAGGEEGEAKGE